MDEKRKKAGQKLLNAAHAFFQACREEGQYGAVQWLEGSGGELVIFTRSEYRQQLMTGVHTMSSQQVHFFKGERMLADGEE